MERTRYRVSRKKRCKILLINSKNSDLRRNYSVMIDLFACYFVFRNVESRSLSDGTPNTSSTQLSELSQHNIIQQTLNNRQLIIGPWFYGYFKVLLKNSYMIRPIRSGSS
jgi:hypothetical protein